MKIVSLFLINLFLISHNLVSSEAQKPANKYRNPSPQTIQAIPLSNAESARVIELSLEKIAVFLDNKAAKIKKQRDTERNAST